MILFWKTLIGMILTAILCLTLGRTENGIALLLTIAAVVMAISVSISFLSPVWDLLREITSIGKLNTKYMAILLKCIGISFGAETASLICADAGSQSLAKIVQILASAIILYLSIPACNDLLAIIQRLAGGT